MGKDLESWWRTRPEEGWESSGFALSAPAVEALLGYVSLLLVATLSIVTYPISLSASAHSLPRLAIALDATSNAKWHFIFCIFV